MRAVSFALLLGSAALLAGCGGPGSDPCGDQPDSPFGKDWSKETIDYSLASPGPFSMRLPLPISDGGTQAEDWVSGLRVPDGWTASLEAMGTGPVLHVNGTGTGTLGSCSMQPESPNGNGCCAEAYLDAAWSGTTQQRYDMTSLEVEVLAGSVEGNVVYTAKSKHCDADARFQGVRSGPGWQSWPGEHSAICS